MMTLGTHPLPEELLIEIGRFAATWTAIEQTIVLNTIELHNFKNQYTKFEWLRLDFKRLRNKWLKISRATLDEEFHSELERLNDRLARAATSRGYILHGVWEVTKGDVWGLKGGKDFRATWWEQKDKVYERYALPTNLSDIADQCARLERLRLDLIDFLNAAHFKPDLGSAFFESL